MSKKYEANDFTFEDNFDICAESSPELAEAGKLLVNCSFLIKAARNIVLPC